MNLVLLLILGVLWGSSYMWIKVAIAEVPTLTFVAWRLTLSALVLWGLLRVRGGLCPATGARGGFSLRWACSTG